MIPSREKHLEFERVAELDRLAVQIAALLAEHKLEEGELQQVLEQAKQMLTPPQVESVVDRAKRMARGW